MENSKKNEQIELITDVYKDCRMGIESISKLLPKVTGEGMKNVMGRHLSSYQAISQRASDMLIGSGQAPVEASFLEKLPAEMGMIMKTAMEVTDAKIAEMMINGYVMGITEMKKQLADVCNVSEDAAKLAGDLVSFQSRSICDMKQFL